jgi:hypothetical protein
MEQPDAGIVRLEAENNVPEWSDENCVATHGNFWEGDVIGIRACVLVRPNNDLEIMAMQMERMLSCIEIVYNDVDILVLIEHIGVRVDAVDGRVGGIVTSGHDGENGWDLGAYIGDVVEEGTGTV